MSKDILMTVQGSHLVPIDQMAEDDVRSLPHKPLMVTVKQPRSLPHTRFYFGIIGSMIKAGAQGTRDTIHNATKIKTGLVSMCQLPNGEFMAFPDSIAFNKMDQTKFNEWFPKAVEFWKACGLADYIAPDILDKLEASNG